ncbi:MAG TPA: ATPase, T2SS/T4P/T4SS family, partial [Bacillota bacterium]|nr:ATPase, T2SS/T4P/T4SS family [Bacillota bacterium]
MQEIQKKTKKRLGMVLIESGILTEDQLIEALQMQLGVDFIDLAAYSIPPELSQVVSVNIARKHTVVPVKVTQDEVVLAMVDPLNFLAVEEVKAATHKRVVQVIARQADVERAIASLYGKKGAVQAIEELERESSGTVSYSTVTTTRIDEVDSASVAPSIRLVNSIIERAVTEQASDIHIEPRENGMVVRMRIDGVMRVIYDIPKNSQASVTARIKIMANLDIAERRVPQDGRALVRSRNLNIDLRISTLPTIYGEKIVIRLLNRSNTALTYEKIGLFGNNLTKFKSLITNRSGVVLLVGPT